MSDSQLRWRVHVGALLFIVLPPLAGGALMGIAGFYPLPGVYRAALSYTGVYILFCSGVAVTIAGLLCHRLLRIARLPRDEAVTHLARTLRPMPLYLIGGLALYSVLGVLTVDLSMIALGLHAPHSRDRTAHLLGATLPALAAALPLFFYMTDTMDRYFAPRHIVVLATSAHVKLVVSSLVAPLLVDITLLAYFTNSTGKVDTTALWIWGLLIAFTTACFGLASMELRKMLKPLQEMVRGRPELARARAVLVPRSLDESGVITLRLLEQITREEKLRHDVDLLTERLVQAVHATRLGIFDYDLVDNEIYWSDAVYDLYGLPIGTPVNYPLVLSLIHPEDRPLVELRVQRIRNGQDENPHLHLHYRVLRADNTVRWVEAHARVYFRMCDGVQTPYRVVGSVVDTTERVAAETARLALEGELQEARRLESMGNFTSGIAHDFNNLLLVIHCNLRAARRELPAAHPSISHLDLAALAAGRGVDLVAQISEFTRGQRSPCAAVPLMPVVSETVRLMGATVPAGVSLSLDADCCELQVRGSDSQLQQVVSNLIRNGIQAIGAGHGAVRVRVRSEHSTDGECHAVISVTDTGIGMSAETRQRIFEPFFTTRPHGAGCGLGLAVVDAIVRSLGGTITVESIPTVGSLFEVRLPTPAKVTPSSPEIVA